MNNKIDKLRKKNIRERQKRLRPGDCQKYIRVVIDSQVLSAPYGVEFMAEMNSAPVDIKYDVRNLPIPESVLWERNMGQLTLEPNEINSLSEVWQKENHVVKILTYAQLINMIKTNTLYVISQNFQKHYSNMQHVVLFMRSNENISSTVSSALIELQIIHQLKVLQVELSAKALVNQIKYFTKAIAEIPYKNQKSEVLSTFKKFVANDKKQCVRVEGTTGFGRLWQQHLNRLPSVTLEVAQSIIDTYSCPKKLLEDLKSNADVAKEIAELKIKRSGPVPLQSDRRIGKVLADKLCVLYNSNDPNTLI